VAVAHLLPLTASELGDLFVLRSVLVHSVLLHSVLLHGALMLGTLPRIINVSGVAEKQWSLKAYANTHLR
jgi:hypothetical protein